jgi:hypothetical protein
LLRPVRPRIAVLAFPEIPPEKRIKVTELLGRQPQNPGHVER